MCTKQLPIIQPDGNNPTTNNSNHQWPNNQGHDAHNQHHDTPWEHHSTQCKWLRQPLNLTLSQETWFTTTTTQIDAIVSQQNKLEQQTSSQLNTILAQIETICTLMEEQWHWQDQYNDYDGYDWDWPFSPEQSKMDKETDNHNNDMHAHLWAAGNSNMEDASLLKWEFQQGPASPIPLDPLLTTPIQVAPDKYPTTQRQPSQHPWHHQAPMQIPTSLIYNWY